MAQPFIVPTIIFTHTHTRTYIYIYIMYAIHKQYNNIINGHQIQRKNTLYLRVGFLEQFNGTVLYMFTGGGGQQLYLL